MGCCECSPRAVTAPTMASQVTLSTVTKLGLTHSRGETKIAEMMDTFMKKLEAIPIKKSMDTKTRNELKKEFNTICQSFIEHKETTKQLINELKTNNTKVVHKSYSEAARSQPKKPEPKPREVVLIYPTADISSDDLKTKIKSKIDVKSIGIGVKNIKKVITTNS